MDIKSLIATIQQEETLHNSVIEFVNGVAEAVEALGGPEAEALAAALEENRAALADAIENMPQDEEVPDPDTDNG